VPASAGIRPGPSLKGRGEVVSGAAAEGDPVGADAGVDEGVIGDFDAGLEGGGEEAEVFLRLGVVGGGAVQGDGAEVCHLAAGGPGLGGVLGLVAGVGELGHDAGGDLFPGEP
jgi:hypothetical protein